MKNKFENGFVSMRSMKPCPLNKTCKALPLFDLGIHPEDLGIL